MNEYFYGYCDGDYYPFSVSMSFDMILSQRCKQKKRSSCPAPMRFNLTDAKLNMITGMLAVQSAVNVI